MSILSDFFLYNQIDSYIDTDIDDTSEEIIVKCNILDEELKYEKIIEIIEIISESLKTEIVINNEELFKILKILIKNAIPILTEYKNIVDIEIDINEQLIIIGDTHGQKDLLEILERNKKPSKQNKYLLLGDYIDRGHYSVENCLLLLCNIILYKENFITLRGNHETRTIYEYYGFLAEVHQKFKINIRETFDLFDQFFISIPLASIISNKYDDKKIFACHGGPAFLQDNQTPATIEDVNNIDRFIINLVDPLMINILWSDPNEYIKININSSRGSGIFFSENKLKEALDILKCTELIRAHELCNGYEQKIKLCNTIFSARKYANHYKNPGGFMILNDKLDKEIIIYNEFEKINSNIIDDNDNDSDSDTIYGDFHDEIDIIYEDLDNN